MMKDFLFTLIFLIGALVALAAMSLLFSVLPPRKKEQLFSWFFNWALSVKFVIPKDYREAMAGDLHEINIEMQAKGHGYLRRSVMVFVNISCTMWHFVRFELEDRFPRIGRQPRPPKRS